MNIERIFKNSYFILFILILCFFWDIGNPNGLRQGTEGFYLQISKEMFNSESYLTPLYLGNPHWSKPPLHFWFPFPLYLIGGGASLLLARASIALISLILIYLISKLIAERFKCNTIPLLVFFCSSLCLIKYSRIFMMEMPLTLLTTLGAILSYSYIYEEKNQYLIPAIISLGLSILIKGPISIVMASLSFGIFSLVIYFKKQFFPIKKLLIVLSGSLIVGSSWFIVSYINYGYEFIEYFFIRENLGKFNAKSYPIRSVFQGLFLYALPWSFFLFYRPKQLLANIKNNQFSLFCFISFISFFVLWLIPNQRSHHYAIPSMIFFLGLIFENINLNQNELKRFFRGISVFFIVILIVSLSCFTFNEFQTTHSFLALGITSSFLLLTIINLNNSASNLVKFSLVMISLSGIWSILIPSFAKPFVPAKTIELNQGKSLTVVVHKPFFVEEATNKKVIVSSPDKIKAHINEEVSDQFLVHEKLYKEKNLHEDAKIITSWKVWQRGRRVKHILSALSSRNLESLQENILLLEKK